MAPPERIIKPPEFRIGPFQLPLYGGMGLSRPVVNRNPLEENLMTTQLGQAMEVDFLRLNCALITLRQEFDSRFTTASCFAALSTSTCL